MVEAMMDDLEKPADESSHPWATSERDDSSGRINFQQPQTWNIGLDGAKSIDFIFNGETLSISPVDFFAALKTLIFASQI